MVDSQEDPIGVSKADFISVIEVVSSDNSHSRRKE